jgi:hypothetical protein
MASISPMMIERTSAWENAWEDGDATGFIFCVATAGNDDVPPYSANQARRNGNSRVERL